MVEVIDAIIGGGVVVLNLIPFIMKRSQLVFVTAVVSVLLIFLLIMFKTMGA